MGPPARNQAAEAIPAAVARMTIAVTVRFTSRRYFNAGKSPESTTSTVGLAPTTIPEAW